LPYFWSPTKFGNERVNFLKSNFTHGYTNLTQLAADEWAGMSFTLLVILQSKDGKEILNSGFLPAMERVITKEKGEYNFTEGLTSRVILN
jgi:hypothetical protein